MVTTNVLTADDVWEMAPEPGIRFELIGGVLKRMPAGGGIHGEIGTEAGWRLASYVSEYRLGRCYTSDTGFVLIHDPDELVMPDVAFVRAERLPPAAERERYMQIPPDLVIEVVSPTDRPGEMKQKIELYQRAGVPLIWLVEPSQRGVTVHKLGRPARFLSEHETLEGEEVVPGFRLPIADLFQ